jgi:hypothetical protein
VLQPAGACQCRTAGEHAPPACSPAAPQRSSLPRPRPLQFWDRRLKQRARELIDDAEWQTLYSCQLLRTSRGKQHGLLVAAWGAGQQLYAAAGDDSGSAGDLLLSSPQPIPRAQALERLNAHAAAARL